MKFLLATSAALPDMSPDDRYLVDELRRRGHEAVPFIWSARRDFDGDALIIRSIWDYYLHPDELAEFVDAAEQSGTPVLNPPATLRWNSDKRYLAHLSGAGVNVVPTSWIDQPDTQAVRQLADGWGAREVILKPTISAAGYRTYRRCVDEDLDAPLRDVLAHATAMIQPFVPEVVADGEWSLVFFDGTVSHSVLKRARAGEFRIQTDHGGTVATRHAPDALARWATDLLRAVPVPTRYARVDAVVTTAGPMLMELELIEPELFFRCDPAAAPRFADILERFAAAG